MREDWTELRKDSANQNDMKHVAVVISGEWYKEDNDIKTFSRKCSLLT